MVWRKSAASVGIEVTNLTAIAEGGGRMIAGTWRSRTPASQIASTASPKASGGKRSRRRCRVHGVNAMRRSAMRPTTPIAPTSAADSAAAANSAAQICTVCP